MNNLQATSLDERVKLNNSYQFQDFIKILNNYGVKDVPTSLEVNTNKFQRFGKNKKYSLIYSGEFGYFKDWSGEIPDITWFSDTTKKTLTFEEKKELYQSKNL